MSSFSVLQQPCPKTFCGRIKDVSLCEKSQIIGKQGAEKTKEIQETTKIGLRSVRRITENWRNSGKPSCLRKKCGREKILNDHDCWSQTHNVMGTQGIRTVSSFKKVANQWD